jgi:hypothetical protein
VAVTAALALSFATAMPAVAKPPPGEWTLVHNDGFRHYACKVKVKSGGWRLKTATWFNGEREAVERGIGVYAAVARGGNGRLPVERTSANWENGYIRLYLRGVRTTDRLWMQAAAYGPVEPWSDGFPVRRIVRCASVA